MLRIGILGAGRIGNVHARAISSHAGSRLAAVSDVNLEAAEKLAAQYSGRNAALRGWSDRRYKEQPSRLLSAGNVIENTVVKSTIDCVVAAKPEYFFLERYMRAYSAEWAAFVDARPVRGDAPRDACLMMASIRSFSPKPRPDRPSREIRSG